MTKKSESPAVGAEVAADTAVCAETDNNTIAGPDAPGAAETAKAEARTAVTPDADVEPDGTDAKAGGEWEDVEERTLRVNYPKGSGVYLRLGPGRSFDPVQTLPNGTTVRALPVPEWARVPGWLCVESEMFHGTAIHGWVDETLVEDAEG